MKKIQSLIIAILALFVANIAQAATGYQTSYVSLGRQSAVIYRPVKSSAKTAIAVVVMHSDDNYLDFPANAELAKRGYTVIATLPTPGGDMGPKLMNIKACVDYLRKQPGIKKVLLLGHSGGATVMTAYELLAENGLSALKGKLFTDYKQDLSHLPKADGMLLLDANYGNAIMSLVSLDPNIKGRGNGANVPEEFNLADPAVGYVAGKSSNYTEAFKARYNRGQRDRLYALMADAQARYQAIKSGNGEFADDEPFIIAGANQIRPFNRLFAQDLSLLSHTKRAWPLVHGNGTVTTEVVHSLRAPLAPDAKSNTLFAANVTTVRGFLSTNAIKVGENFRVREDSIEGVDWTSNINNPIGNSTGIHVPVLMMGMTGSWEYLAAEIIYDHIASKDKSLGFVEGASHMFAPDHDAEVFQGRKFGDTTKALFDYVDKWLSAKGRFM